jgi:hypothetical protein
MNDPMEGFYRASKMLKGREDYKEIVRQITDSKSNIGIACFTETREDVLMWTHYAGNYMGMCIEYSAKQLIDGLPNHVSLARLAYVDQPPLIVPSQTNNASTAATRILSQKKYNWAYEREWRILGSVGPVYLGSRQPVKAIYFGSRVQQNHRHRILSRIQATGIEAYMMEVDGYDHRWSPVNPAAKQKRVKASGR